MCLILIDRVYLSKDGVDIESTLLDNCHFHAYACITHSHTVTQMYICAWGGGLVSTYTHIYKCMNILSA